MTLIAVSPRRGAWGVEAPGFKKSVPRGSEPREHTYDWRCAPGSPENTAGIVATFRVIGAAEAFAHQYRSDAHLVTYVLQDTETGLPLTKQPRINKSCLPWLHWQGFEVRADLLVADVDNPRHERWTPETRKAFDELWNDPPEVLQTTGVYLTRAGYRLVQPLDEPLSVANLERYIASWLHELHSAGVPADPSCKDWTRLMRLPSVRRDGRIYASPMIDLGRMAPRVIEPAPKA